MQTKGEDVWVISRRAIKSSSSVSTQFQGLLPPLPALVVDSTCSRDEVGLSKIGTVTTELSATKAGKHTQI